MDNPMPPRSYVLTAVFLSGFVGISVALTSWSSITVWYWLFAAAACILGVAGVFKIADRFSAPRWVGISLASPGLVWAIATLRDLIGQPIPITSVRFDLVAAYLAVLAAG